MESAALNLSRELVVAQAAARAAGDYLLPRLGAAQAGKVKSARDTQLDVDLGAQKLLISAIRAAFPDDAILSEEDESAPPAASRRWIVDPLDGSFNFQHGYPLFGVAIGLQVEGVTSLGVLYMPHGDELYTAIRGHGAFRNGQSIHTSQTATLDGALVHVSDFAFSGKPGDNAQRVRIMTALATQAGRVRMAGTAVADFAWVASGQADGVIMYSLHPWDVEAGALLVAEAGGAVSRVTMPSGVAAYVGGNRQVQQELARIVAGE